MNNKIDLSAAKIIEPNDKIRAESCLEKIKRILRQHDCTMIPVVTIAGGKIKSEVTIVALSRENQRVLSNESKN